MAETRQAERPLSPHLQIYRFTITMAMSIIHRITGAGLYVGTLLLAAWLISVAMGPDAYAAFQSVAGFSTSCVSVCSAACAFSWTSSVAFTFSLSAIRGPFPVRCLPPPRAVSLRMMHQFKFNPERHFYEPTFKERCRPVF